MEALELLGSRASGRLGTKLARLEASHGSDEDHQSLLSITAEGGVLERIWQTLNLKDQREEEAHEEEAMSTFKDAVVVLQAVTPGAALLKVNFFKTSTHTSK